MHQGQILKEQKYFYDIWNKLVTQRIYPPAMGRLPLVLHALSNQ